jgi:hypothetical protein
MVEKAVFLVVEGIRCECFYSDELYEKTRTSEATNSSQVQEEFNRAVSY